MLNKAKKKAIVEWVNCMLTSDPIESFNHLSDGDTFFKLCQLISPTEDEFETCDEKYSFVEKCLNEFYKTTIDAHVNLEACKQGDQFPVATLSMLLLTAVVHCSLAANQTLLQGLTLLDPRVQEDIQECISSILLGDDKNTTCLPPNFSAVLNQQTKYKEHPGPTPKKHSSTPSYQTPKRDTRNRKRGNDGQQIANSPIPSPLKTLLDSPQVRQKVALREAEREVTRLRGLLHLEQDKNADLENENKSCQKALSDKDYEIANLKERVNELHEHQDIADELSQCKIDEEAKIENALKQHNKKHEALQKEYEKLKIEKDKQNQEMCDMLKEQTFAKVEMSEKGKKIQELQEDILSLKDDLRAMKSEFDKAVEEKKNFEEISKMNQMKYEEVKRDLARIEEDETSSFSGECLGVAIAERQQEDIQKWIDRLKAENGKKISVIENLKKKIEDKNNKIKESEISRASLQQNLQSASSQSAGLSAENSELRKKIEKYMENSEKDKLECETLRKSNSDWEIKLLEIEKENIMIKAESDSVKMKLIKLEELLAKIKSNPLIKENAPEITELVQLKESNEALLEKNERWNAYKSEKESEVEKVASEVQLLRKEVEEKNKFISTLEAELSEMKKLNVQSDENELSLKVGNKPVVDLIKDNVAYTKIIQETNAKYLQREMDYGLLCQEKDALAQHVTQLKEEMLQVRQEADGFRSQIASLITVVRNEINIFLGEAGVSSQEHLGFDSGVESYPEGEVAFLISHIHKLVSSYHKLKADYRKLKDNKGQSADGTEGNVEESNMEVEENAELIALSELYKKSVEDNTILKSQLDTELNNYVEVMSQKEHIAVEFEQTKKELDRMSALVYEQKDVIDTLNAREKEIHSENQKLEKEIASLESGNQKLEKEVAGLKSDLQSSKKKLADVNAKSKDIRAEVGKFTAANKKLNIELSNKSAMVKDLESENDKLRLDKEKLHSKINKLTGEIDKLKNRSRRSSSSSSSTSREVQSLESECEKLREERSFYKEKAEKSKKLEQELKQKNKEIHTLKSKVENLSNCEDEMEQMKSSLMSKIEEAEQQTHTVKKEYESKLELIRKQNSTLKDSFESQLKAKESALLEIHAKISQRDDEKQAILNECEQLQSQVADLQEQLNAAGAEMQALHQSLNQINSEKLTRESELHACFVKHEEQITKFQEVHDQKMNELRAELLQLKEEKENVENTLNETNGDLHNALFRLAELEKLEVAYKESQSKFEALHISYVDLQMENTKLQSRVNEAPDQSMYSLNEERNSHPAGWENEGSETGISQADKICELESELKSAASDIECHMEKIECLERELRIAQQKKECAEKEYFLCIQQKDGVIEELDRKNSELQLALKQADAKISDAESASAVDEVKNEEISFVEQNESVTVINAEKLQSLEEKLVKTRERLEEAKKELRRSYANEDYVKMEYVKLFGSIQQRVMDSKNEVTKELMEVQDKLEKTEQKLIDVDSSKLTIERELTEVRKVNEDLKKELQTLEREVERLEEENSSMPKQELEMVNQSLMEMTEQVKQSEASITKMREENRSLLAQLDFANKQIKEMKKDADRRNMSSTSFKRERYTRAPTSAATNSKIAEKTWKKDSKKSPSDSPKRRASSFKNEPVTKKHRKMEFFSSPSPLKKFLHKSKEYKLRSRNSSVVSQRNASNYSRVKQGLLVSKSSSPVPSTSSGLNTSVSNRKCIADWFKCEDEDDYLIYNSLPTLRGYHDRTNGIETPGRRVSELQRRNTLVPPHMRTSYPVEMQMQSEEKYPQDAIREGSTVAQEERESVNEDSDEEEASSASESPSSPFSIDSESKDNPWLLWQQKVCKGLTPEESEEKLHSMRPDLKGLPLMAMNPYTPDGKRINPFKLPYRPSWYKKMKNSGKHEK